MVDFKGFEKIVDTLAPNGIEIDVEKKMSENIDVTLEPGLQRLNGKELLGYADSDMMLKLILDVLHVSKRLLMH